MTRKAPYLKVELFELFEDPFVQSQFSRRKPIHVEALGRGCQVPTAEDVVVQKLRSFLRVAAKNYMHNEWKKATRQKRGGGATVFSLESMNAEQCCSLDHADEETPERIFDRQLVVLQV